MNRLTKSGNPNVGATSCGCPFYCGQDAGRHGDLPLPLNNLNFRKGQTNKSNIPALGAEGAVFAILLIGDGDEVRAQEDVAEQGIQVAAEAGDLFRPFLR